MVGIDLIILITYTLVEGLQDHFKVVIMPNRENPRTLEGVSADDDIIMHFSHAIQQELGIVTENFVYVCDSKARNIFLGILYGYKMLLQIIALLFAFSIRKVRIKGLNDAKYIAAIIYVTSIVLAVIIVATYTLNDFINGFAALFCTGFLVGTSTILILVFVPMVHIIILYREWFYLSISQQRLLCMSWFILCFTPHRWLVSIGTPVEITSLRVPLPIMAGV